MRRAQEEMDRMGDCLDELPIPLEITTRRMYEKMPIDLVDILVSNLRALEKAGHNSVDTMSS